MLGRAIKLLTYAIISILVLLIAIVLLIPKPEDTPCQADWRKCKDNADVADNYRGMFGARFDCRSAAERLARFGKPQWPDQFFTRFKPGADATDSGKILLFEPEALFQNGYGAMAHTRLACEYDLAAQRVIDVQWSQK
jgi:hypothetical protein